MKNILVLTFWSFNDPLIQTYTLPYVKIMLKNLPNGSKIYLQTLEQEFYQWNETETQDSINVLKQEGIIVLRRPYRPLGINAVIANAKTLWVLSRIIVFKNIKYVHAWCTTAGVLGFILSFLWKKTFVIDSYEPHAEAMVENGSWKRNSIAFSFMRFFERIETRKASYIIGATYGMKNYALEKYQIDIKRFYVKPACVNVSQFDYKQPQNNALLEELCLKDKTVMLYAGKFGGIYYDKEVFEFIKVASDYFGNNKFRVLLLSNIKETDLQNLCESAGVIREQIILRFVKHEQIHEYMNLADFAICPVMQVPTKKYCTPVKNGEYWAMGLPVIIPANISDDSSIITRHKIGYVWSSPNKEEYLASCKAIQKLLLQDGIREKIRKIAFEYRDFDIAQRVYKQIYG